MLNHIHQNADMACDSIKNVMKLTDNSEFTNTLASQLREYQDAKSSTERMLKDRQEYPENASNVSKLMSHVSSSVKSLTDRSPSKLAEIMIEGSTMGIVNLSKQINDYTGKDREVLSLAKRHLKTEQSNIDEMKKFLHE